MKKASYGFDAPDFTRVALLLGAAAATSGAVLLGRFGIVGNVVGGALLVGGLFGLLLTAMLVAYRLRGKFRIRDGMLGLVE